MSTGDAADSIARFLIKHFNVNTDLTDKEARIYLILDWLQFGILVGYCALWLFILAPRGYQIIPGLSFKNPNPSHLSRAIAELNLVIAGVIFWSSLVGGAIIATCARNKIRIHWLSKCISFFVKDLYEAGDQKSQDENDVSRNP
jgi:hypothetical protein